jgi:gamma-D-glutamyl-L-lysine dipeptidyl-peptidase
MDYGMVNVPAAAVRKKAKHTSEMTNQLLFGEFARIIKEKDGGWIKIRSLHDDYEGWTRDNLLLEVTAKEAKIVPEYVTTETANTIRFNEMTLQVPMGSSLPGFADGKGMISGQSYILDGKYRKRNEQHPDNELIKHLAFPWLNAPYLWGGRTQFGVDCSGFVQVIFKMMGIDMPRDAWQQAQKGKTVNKLKEAVCGDLAFFDDKEEIVHVGMLLNNDQIIHSSGKVRIDAIDKKGIVHSDTGKYTHRLRAIKRGW